MSLNAVSYALPPEVEDSVKTLIDEFSREEIVQRIWKKDAGVWTGGHEAKWLGWLTIADEEADDSAKYKAFYDDVSNGDFTHALLMGMGGSSLCPEVLALTFGIDNFYILDSTVPAQVAAVESQLDLAKTLFIVASKSGSTLEPNCFKQYFFDRLSQISDSPGNQFVAITDPGSKLDEIARNEGFRHIFYGKPEVGGRFSALSAFGLTAAAAMGLDVDIFLARALEMAELCKRGNPSENPGALLGLVLGACHRIGRDKLTIVASPEVFDLGAWLEQLIAESTGKNGVAIIPVDREPVMDAENYYSDRVFCHIGVKGTPTEESLYQRLEDIERAGHPVIRLELESLYHISQEFFRWEFATAVAGAVMGINPFDQPDVESAKIEAKKITEEFERVGSLPAEAPFFSADGLELFAGEREASRLNGPTIRDILHTHLNRLGPDDYFALLAYVEMNGEMEKVLQSIRNKVLERHLSATCLGFGPRFLHSTGQAYKGGPNTGVFLQITADDALDLPVPGNKFSFGVVKAAQARGDFQVLTDRGRRALRIHISGDVIRGLQKILDII